MSEPPASPFSWIASAHTPPAQIADAWLHSGALARLASGPGTADLLAWSNALLDTRHGEERHNAPMSAWDERLVDRVIDAAAELGLISTLPPQRMAYEATILLGGTALGNRLRSELARDIASRPVQLGQLVIATAQRPIDATERRRETIPADQTFEWQNALQNVERSFGVIDASHPMVSGKDGDIPFLAGNQSARLLIAPPSQKDRRATTADTIRFVLERLRPSELTHVLLITSAIYAPYQFFVAAPQLLARGTRYIELVGTTTTIDGDRRALAQRVGQEIHAAIKAAIPLDGS